MKPDVLMQLIHANIVEIKETLRGMDSRAEMLEHSARSLRSDVGKLARGFDTLAVGLGAVAEAQSDLEARVSALEAKAGK